MVKSVMDQTKVPSETAVKKTPNVDKTIPSLRIGLTAVLQKIK